MDVLEDDHLWQALGLAEHEPAKGVEQLTPTLLGIHVRNGGVAGVDAEEVADVGEDRPQIITERQHGALDLVDDRVLVVAILDPELPPQEVDQRVEGRWTGRTRRSVLPPSRPGRRRVPTKLVHQA